MLPVCRIRPLKIGMQLFGALILVIDTESIKVQSKPIIDTFYPFRMFIKQRLFVIYFYDI